jgi:hypothetical protein
MATPARAPLVSEYQSRVSNTPGKNEAFSSGVSWAAVVAGAFVAASLSLVLLALGTGIGLSAISPWSNTGGSASTVSKGAILWMIVMQIISASMGGYLAGRLRTKWVDVHTDEVYFRDTAHGFLVWAVGVVITAAFLASAATSMVGGSLAGGPSARVQPADRSVDSTAYFVDSLFRSSRPEAISADASTQAEATIIFANALRHRDMPATDRIYLGQLIVAKTGLSQSESEKRVSDSFAEAQQEADAIRRAIAHSLYWLFLALLIGAFSASFAATVGGRQRDRVVAI